MELDLKINEFEGPLDLLLHLIKENKMDIFDIKIEEITEQYLSYIRKQESMNLEIDSEYLVLASELIEIKSKLNDFERLWNSLKSMGLADHTCQLKLKMSQKK